MPHAIPLYARLRSRLARLLFRQADGERSAIARRAGQGRPYEPEMYELFRQALRPGMLVVDVGAHEGLFTHLAAALVGPTGHVWAVEPAPRNFRTLRRRTAAFPQVTAIQAAASDRSGFARFALDSRNSTQHSLFPANVGRRWRSWPVRTIALARALPEDLPRLDLIKIDAQGAEPQVLRGARPVIKVHRPLLVFELWPTGWRRAGHDPAAVLDSLTRLGYALYYLSARKGLLPESHVRTFLDQAAGRWQSINVVALHRKSRARADAMIAGG
jgi:FkbM family methyltransferase